MAQDDLWVETLRASHERFKQLTESLSAEQAAGQSYDTEWTIADVASHLGSGAEIFTPFLTSALAGEPAPGTDGFSAIWDRWNAMAPLDQVAESIAANESFVATAEAAPADQRDAMSLSMFGMDLDFAGLLGMRLGEHALHVWDIDVALNPGAQVNAAAVGLLADRTSDLAARVLKPVEDGPVVALMANDLDARLVVDTAAGALSDADDAEPFAIPGEALLRLVYGRLDEYNTPSEIAADPRLPALRQAFPGF